MFRAFKDMCSALKQMANLTRAARGIFLLCGLSFGLLCCAETRLQVVRVCWDPRALAVTAEATLCHETRVGTRSGLHARAVRVSCVPWALRSGSSDPSSPLPFFRGRSVARLLLVLPLPSARREVSNTANGLGGGVGFLFAAAWQAAPASWWGFASCPPRARLACATPPGDGQNFTWWVSSPPTQRHPAKGGDVMSRIRAVASVSKV